jgi:hypothetical protein
MPSDAVFFRTVEIEETAVWGGGKAEALENDSFNFF